MKTFINLNSQKIICGVVAVLSLVFALCFMCGTNAYGLGEGRYLSEKVNSETVEYSWDIEDSPYFVHKYSPIAETNVGDYCLKHVPRSSVCNEIYYYDKKNYVSDVSISYRHCDGEKSWDTEEYIDVAAEYSAEWWLAMVSAEYTIKVISANDDIIDEYKIFVCHSGSGKVIKSIKVKENSNLKKVIEEGGMLVLTKIKVID